MIQMKIGVIGGGAAGMMAAITAAEAGAQVTLLEGGDRVGKKILATGNGKCNLGNLKLCAEDYNGAEKEWMRECITQFDTQATILFFRRLGLMIRERNGYLYPLAEQASVVLDVLRTGLRTSGVRVITDCKVNDVSVKNGGGFDVKTGDSTFCFDRVILACGSKASPKTGSDGSGYKIAKRLGHRIVPVVPALVQLRCREAWFKEIAGVRADACLRVLGTSDKIEERGELQLTEYGISGIPVFQLSRKVNYIQAGNRDDVKVVIDFLPDYDRKTLEDLLKDRMKNGSGQTVEEFFTGMLNKKLMFLFIRLAGLKRGAPFSAYEEAQLRKVYELCKEFTVHVTGSNSFENAQVCAGGVDTAQVGTDMETLLVPGLFFAGELLDVDGRCGGYNLQWAWCSGYLAGKNAAKI